jgi:hypothetical protein
MSWTLQPLSWPFEVTEPLPKSKIGVAETTPKSLGVAQSPPFGLWVASTTYKGQTLNNFLFFFLTLWWWTNQPQAKRGWPSHLKALGCGFGHPHVALWGWLSHPSSSSSSFSSFFFFFFFGFLKIFFLKKKNLKFLIRQGTCVDFLRPVTWTSVNFGMETRWKYHLCL